jgi:elongation factor Ts
MDCKKALTEAAGDEDQAVRLLRERGAQVQAKRSGRTTAFGRFGLYANLAPGVGAMVELQCESAPVTQNEEFIQLANDLAEQLALGPGAATTDELLDQPSPSKQGQTLREQKDDLFNRTREVFNVARLKRIDGPCGGYCHNAATVAGVLVEVDGGDAEAAKDVCMHIAASRPSALNKDQLDPAEVDQERAILREAALKEGKPEKIVDKMVEGRLRNFYAERVLVEQPFVKEQKMTVGAFAKQRSMEIKQFVHWEMGK